MPQLSEVARFNRTLLPEELINNEEVRNLYRPGDNYILATEMVWAVLHAESIRQNKPVWVGDHNVNGRSIVGMGPVQAIETLWPDLHKKERNRTAYAIRKHLVASNNAKCLQQARGAPGYRFPVQLSEWWVAEEFQPLNLKRPENAKSAPPRKVKVPEVVPVPEPIIEAPVRLPVPNGSLTHPRDDYHRATRMAWDHLRKLFDDSRAELDMNGRLFIDGRIDWVKRVVHALWPELGVHDKDNAVQSISRHLRNNDLYGSGNGGVWLAPTWKDLPPYKKHAPRKVVPSPVVTDTEWLPDDSATELPATNGDPVVDAVKTLLEVVISQRAKSNQESAQLREENRRLQAKLDAIHNAIGKL